LLRGRFVALIAAHAITRMGFWMAFLGMMSLASFTLHTEASGTAFVLGALGAPFIVLAPFSGALVDRTSARFTLGSTYVVGVVLALILTRVDALWSLVLIAALWGASGTLVFPSLGAMVKRGLVREDQLPRANGIINAGWEVTLIAGPALSGWLAHRFSEATPFYVSAALYATGLCILAFVPSMPGTRGTATSPGHLMQGVALLFRRRDLRAVATWGGVAVAAFSAVLAVEPVFVRDVLHGGPERLGFIYSIGGIGAACGALVSSGRRFARREMTGIAIAFGLYGVAAIAYGAIADWPAILPAVVALQLGFSVSVTLSQILVQRRSPQELVGRALAAQRGVEQSFDIVGTLAGGATAAAIGARSTLLLAGGVAAGAAIVLAGRARTIGRAPEAAEAEPTAVAAPDALQPPPIALERFD
jgi:predicted MFS family arabinose efflux permease